jgi:hypothetical protein
MGWTYTSLGKGQAGDYFRKMLTNDTEERSTELLRGAFRGFREYYGAVKTTIKGTGESYVWGFCAMIDWRKNDSFNFGYKDMDETMGPYMFNCPNTILDLLTDTPHDNESSREWRKACRERNASILKPKHGDIIKTKGTWRFNGGWELDTFYVKKEGRRTRYLSVSDSGHPSPYQHFKLGRKALQGATVIAQQIPA